MQSLRSMGEKIAPTKEIQSRVARPPRGRREVSVPLPRRTLISNEIIETALAIIALFAIPILATLKEEPVLRGPL
jgi:hypothetical protein